MKNRAWLSILILLSLILAACGGEPEPTAVSQSTSEPAATLRPTFTATIPVQPSNTPPPPTKVPPTTRPESSATLPPSPTPMEETPTPAATRSQGTLPKLSGTLLFPIFDTTAQTYHIYRMDLATGEMEIYIKEASQPAVTLTGNRIAWRSWKADQRGLLSRPLDGVDIWQMISFTEAARPDWSPDGQRFVFPSRQEPDRQSRLYLFTGVGDEPFIEIQRHGSPIMGRTPVFTPDGRIVYQGCIENTCGLYVMDADGANPRQLTNAKDDTVPAISPDGRRVAYMTMQSGSWQVAVVNLDGSDQRRLTDDWYWNGLPVWSPDGKHIIFVSTRDENWPDNFVLSENTQFRLWVMDADGSNQWPLHDNTFRLDGVPAGAASHEAGGWIEERLVWLP